jgi:CheY-like chemotaxis protein
MVANAALVVDDSEIAREFLIDVLKKLGIRDIRQAENGARCLGVIHGVKPDVVFLDIEMPVMNGLEVLKEIRKFDRGTKVVMTTSVATAEIVKACIDRGADFCLKSPPRFSVAVPAPRRSAHRPA